MHKCLRIAFLLYFTTHIPITLCIDLQALLGHLYPAILRSLYDWYVDTFNDWLFARPPYWYNSFIISELCLQLPFFFFACYGLYYKKNWLRIPSIVYGSHVATTVWAIGAEILCSDVNTVNEKLWLTLFYTPYFACPLMLTLYMSVNEIPFGLESIENKNSKSN